ncbi:LysR family transcriptional regulator [Rhodobacteraceae bacterium HSP-20]|uniref:LysR family transcriptional regulator n=1 Tax=Paragemmobacter amnigenus TaxID=2852097 RepID=A0ABS6J105_9RHOB|nr:LysR family transcriptional regulator [Rhodobacter amnigenus]MBU9697207.1 LysR family transcriptional regulator [Rhodobacter amnigenus]MBV4388434.1 LysR family transcriptional regulator [Rhodobacter amnigenus]
MPLRFTLRQLEYLVAVAECGSVALAAERCHVSSPSISAAIAQLEQEFGLQLFIRRHAQGLSLTEGGRQFTDAARAVLAAGAGLNDRAAELTGQVRGPLAVGCLLTFAQVVLPHLRRSFAAAHPAVDFRQSEHDHAGLIEALRHATIDVALSYDLQIPSDLDFLPLLPLAPYALLPEDHPLAGRATVTAADLAAHDMVLLDLPYSADYFLSFFTAEGLRPRIAERTRDMGVMRAMVANGFGYSIANIRLGSDRAPDGRRLVFVPLETAQRPMRMGLILPAGAPRRRAVAAFADHCLSTVTDAMLPGLVSPDG